MKRLRRDADDDYRPLSGRRRLLILLLAVSTALVVIWLMLRPQLRKLEADAQRRAVPSAPCAPGQQQGCVGGTMGVIGAPAPTPASAPPR